MSDYTKRSICFGPSSSRPLALVIKPTLTHVLKRCVSVSVAVGLYEQIGEVDMSP